VLRWRQMTSVSASGPHPLRLLTTDGQPSAQRSAVPGRDDRDRAGEHVGRGWTFNGCQALPGDARGRSGARPHGSLGSCPTLPLSSTSTPPSGLAPLERRRDV